ncbi:BTB/POZ domain containing protein [Acanthamoeba castellanii str. Neff]|uniref:BTB/POZ domain containing protein n=1 Tax=Acanthamoeba castellanii (strain ATCC 30010 / Neff) TaxID=1257118 RepID=L8HLW4_ACACF|nr:BTB/POZ domain containing protein [Acanthamoeba castellanii str. Neff]ELR25643.1 BTB/POZ domain containing protein [Acanthamoeba castellanii str. Neff]
MTATALRTCTHPQLQDPLHGDITVIVHSSDESTTTTNINNTNTTTTYYVHRLLLSLWSPVFRTMLTNGMRESTHSVVHLREHPLHAPHFGLVLARLYPNAPPMAPATVHSVLYFVDKYDLPAALRLECEAVLLRQPRSWALLVTAQTYGLASLLARHAEWASANLDSVPDAPPSAVEGALLLGEIEVETWVKIMRHTMARLTNTKQLLRKMLLASNCNMCGGAQGSAAVAVCGRSLYCSHHVQFMCLLASLTDTSP